ncbi:(2Fe-2S)-binding protein [Pseudonocardia yuanmonensis]|uniref:(2Fe-2S)-binding protein n=1 Tax=Pseudonocardia yuanmonensis TaxID=1095914 RepID=A0ABP8X5W4_9PSEU
MLPDHRLVRPAADPVIVALTVNGEPARMTVETRTSLADALRDELGLTGTHVACEQGVCGACTVEVDGEAVRACLLLAVQAEGAEVRTVEGLAAPDEPLHPIQQAFTDHHALQCGFCTPGLLMTAHRLLTERRGLDEHEVRTVVSGHLCRCTGYQGIVDAILHADRAWERPDAPAAPTPPEEGP